MLVLCMFLCSCPYVSIFESLISNFYDPDLYVRCSDIFLCSYPNFKFEKKKIVSKYNGGFACMHMSVHHVAYVSFLHLYSKFKLKNGPLNIFYAHSCRFLWSETFVCSYPYVFIHASLCFYARPSFYTCVPRFLCPCKIMNSISVDVFICHCSAL